MILNLKHVQKNCVVVGLILLASSLFAQSEEQWDEAITNRIDQELFYQADVPANSIDVITSQKIVTLSGTVDDLLSRERAEKVAMAVKGVQAVINRIEVQPPTRVDASITADIKEALARDPATEAYEVAVTTNDGTVQLSGEVDSWQEKRLSTYVAKQVSGVKALDNNLTVNYTDNRSDQEIASEIRQAIVNDIRLYQSQINVRVKDSRVYLDGLVGSSNAKILAENYGWTSGVETVDAEGIAVKDWLSDDELKLNANPYPKKTAKEIKTAINKVFLFDPRIASYQPKVHVSNGVVTLSGTVDNLLAKRTAEADALNVVGVLYVKNNLKVRPDGEISPMEAQKNAQMAIKRDVDLQSSAIEVKVNKQTATLEGQVENDYESNKAEDIVANIEGIVEVNNKLEVEVPGNIYYYHPFTYADVYPSPYTRTESYYRTSLTDSQILDNINSELWWSPFVNADQVNVEVENGVALLTGTVDSWRERASAVENAREGGARDVIDRLDVDIVNQ